MSENETTLKDSSSSLVQNPTQNINTSVPQVEKEAPSNNTRRNEGVKEDDTSKQVPGDAENLEKDAAPQSTEDENASKIPSPPSDDKQETAAPRTSSPHPAPLVQEIPPPPDQDHVSQTTETSSFETADAEASKQDSSALPDLHPVDMTPVHTTLPDPQPVDTTPTHVTLPDPQPLDTTPAHTTLSDPQHMDTTSLHTTLPDPQPADTTPLHTALPDPQSVDTTPAHITLPDPQPPRTAAQNEITPEESSPHDQSLTPSVASRDASSSAKKEPMQPLTSGGPEKVRYQDADSHTKKSRFWKKFAWFSNKKNKAKSPKLSADSDAPSPSKKPDYEALSKLIESDLRSLHDETAALKNYNDRLIELNKDARQEFETNVGNHEQLRKSMIKLKLLIPSRADVDSGVFKDLQSRLKARETIPKELFDRIPKLHNNHIFCRSPEFQDFNELYRRLEPNLLRLCLLCFSIFPGNETIRKRSMVRWWLAEGLSSEEDAAEHFETLRTKGFIVPVNENKSPFTGRYLMHPLHQSMLKMLAQEARFFNFDENGKPTQNYRNSFQVCLVGEGLFSYEDLQNKVVTIDGLEKVHLVMNVDEHILDFKPHWFSMMRNVNLLYLGRWQASDAAHIEVEDTKFLDDGLKNMNSIKFFSLQGVSNIIELSESILDLKRLECLDLRACHNLESIPSGIGSLTCLTHLDMSECYLLAHMPKSLSKLKNLKVFKGFVVNNKESQDQCTLEDLKSLENLNKLCIYTTWKDFPQESHIGYLAGFTKLCKLSIAWGGEASKEEEKDGGDTSNSGTERDGSKLDLKCFLLKKVTPTRKLEEIEGNKERGTSNNSEAGGDSTNKRTEEIPAKLPSGLQKLDLKCFPLEATPRWLETGNLESLQKLYIRGGKFSDLGQYQDNDHWSTSPKMKNVWKVKELRLKYLANLEMEWRQLHELFPDLVYLEQISCPKLKLFNCGAAGVWIKPKAMEKEHVGASL